MRSRSYMRPLRFGLSLLGVGLGLLATSSAHAQIVFDWKFVGNGWTDVGRFLTSTGSAPGGIAPAATYHISDWLVTNSQSDPTLNGKSITNGGLTQTSTTDFIWNGTSFVGTSPNGVDFTVRADGGTGDGYDFVSFQGISASIINGTPGNYGSYSASIQFSVDANYTPEPGLSALFAASGLVTIYGLRRRKLSK